MSNMTPITTVYKISSTPNPQRLCAIAMHNDYSEDFVGDSKYWMEELSEEKAGKSIVDNCLKYGHYGVCEHASITLGFKSVPHSVMQQLRTHRVGISFDIQSIRYSGKRFVEWYRKHENSMEINTYLSDYEELFYIREPGTYQDRFGNKIDYTEDMRLQDLVDGANQFFKLVGDKLIDQKMPYEMFRDYIPAGYRQNMIVTGNARTWMHLFDLRIPKDAQLEINYAMEEALKECLKWMPEVYTYYIEKRKGKNKLAP